LLDQWKQGERLPETALEAIDRLLGELPGVNEVKRSRVETALRQDATRSNRQIAELIGVDVGTVIKWREPLVENRQVHRYEFTTAKTGKHSAACWWARSGDTWKNLPSVTSSSYCAIQSAAEWVRRPGRYQTRPEATGGDGSGSHSRRDAFSFATHAGEPHVIVVATAGANAMPHSQQGRSSGVFRGRAASCAALPSFPPWLRLQRRCAHASSVGLMWSRSAGMPSITSRPHREHATPARSNGSMALRWRWYAPPYLAGMDQG
jgi:hypothetical protein